MVQFFIVDKLHKNTLKPWNGKTAIELHYRGGGLRGREIGELFRVGDRSVSQGAKGIEGSVKR